MSWYTLEPRDPLMVRDGRPFGLDTDGARSLDFPPPSVTAGAVRTRLWRARAATGAPLTETSAKAIAVRGPLLCSLDPEHTLWLPRPLDAVQVEGTRFRLQPGQAWEPGTSSLPRALRPIEPAVALPKGKVNPASAFWSRSLLQSWLADPPASSDAPQATATRPTLVHERRTHLAIDPDTRTGEDGKLYQTDGLVFRRGDGAQTERLALMLSCAEPDLAPGLVTLGGERRLSILGRSTNDPRWPAPAITGTRARVILLTPAVFDEGAIPATIGGARVVAAAVGRGSWLSGWDMKAGGPKKSRRLAPVGSVYWVELGMLDPSSWVKHVHFQEISSNEQDRRDGFGLAAVGVWA